MALLLHGAGIRDMAQGSRSKDENGIHEELKLKPEHDPRIRYSPADTNTVHGHE